MKKLLLIAVPMGGYEHELIKGLQRRGFEVDFFKEAAKVQREELKLWQRGLRSLVNDLRCGLFRNTLEKIESDIYQRHIAGLADQYDYVLDFAGKAKINCLRLLKLKYQCPFILYLWDDLKHASAAVDTLKYFDKKYSFNEDDSARFGLTYRPNFFVDSYRYDGQTKSIDVFYKGTARDRYRAQVIERVATELGGHQLELSLYVRGGYLRNRKKVTGWGFFNRWCNRDRFSLSQMATKFKQSKVLLDIAYKGQTGLSLRPVEALAANCKLITTNKSVVKYDFFSDHNIFVLEEDFSNLSGLGSFLSLPFLPYSAEVKYRYSIDGFIDDVFPEMAKTQGRSTRFEGDSAAQATPKD